MTWLAVWFLAVGVMDLSRVAGPRRWVAPAVGVATLWVVTIAAGLTSTADVLVILASVLPLLGWWCTSERAQGRRGRAHVLALTSMAAGVLLLLGFSGWAGAPGGVLGAWVGWAHLPFVGSGGVSPDHLGRLLLVVGLVVANLSTANILVRLVLVSIGALRPQQTGSAQPAQPADRLRGGRLLGPMERLLILGLGLAGQLTAAGLVIGAKGLIRFPELQSRAKDGTGVDGVGIDEMTEYFLVGSFVSWLVALSTLALTF